MDSDIVRGIGLVVVLGIGLQWAARRLRVPSIVLLLAGGLVVGPGFGLVDPDEIFGEALFPVVSLAVGLLLFHGGLELRLADLRGGVRRPVLRLVTVGALVTWGLGALTVHLVFGEPVRVSVLAGAVLVVSGPTVVGPLLRLARPRDPDATILRWEGILIDPLGAALGLFCLNAFFIDELAVDAVWGELVAVALAGAAAGLVGAALLVTALRRFAVPDELEVAVALMLVVAAYVTGEVVRPEAGLFATTTMGLALANQRYVPIDALEAFGRPVVALLIGGLFIVLAAGAEADPLADHLVSGLMVAAVLVLVVRPLAVLASTAGSTLLSWRERAFLACMAPRGVVAAATASLYSLRLEDIGEASDILLPLTFTVIIALAVVYGVGSVAAARWLGVARPRPRGALVVGDRPWALGLAGELSRNGVPTVLAARGRADLAARDDLPFSVHASLLIDLPRSGLLTDVRGAVVASRDDETDLIALGVLVEALGRSNVWLLPAEAGTAAPGPDDRAVTVASWTRRPFAPGVSHDVLERSLAAGGRVTTVAGTDLPEGALVLARVRADGSWTASAAGPFAPDDRLVVLDGAAVGPAGAGTGGRQ
ncbi:MAG TPA: cation:proton antiporter [Acidimicrobiales bacterium]|nr:cation:proton antiporter [Acidimicrobiales bacterium]